MYRIAVMGDYESICGFAAMGFEIFPEDNASKAVEALRRLAREQYGILYITEGLAAQVKGELAKLRERPDMTVIQIPGVSHNTGAGIAGVRKTVETAAGADILFG